ncbi:hypothetical protein ACSBR1_004947 [Camellia fascicularis]
MKTLKLGASLLILLTLLVAQCLEAEAQMFANSSSQTKAVLTLNSFQEGGDGGGPSECDNKYHPNDTPVVALSTGWYNRGSRCHNYITVSANGQSVKALVVDECDSTMGCDGDHDYQPPCPNNIVDASKAVWEALGVEAQVCKPTGNPFLPGKCNAKNDSDYCTVGKLYTPLVTNNKKAQVLTLTDYEKSGDGWQAIKIQPTTTILMT